MGGEKGAVFFAQLIRHFPTSFQSYQACAPQLPLHLSSGVCGNQTVQSGQPAGQLPLQPQETCEGKGESQRLKSLDKLPREGLVEETRPPD